jgi:hypothetical protein
MNHEKILEIEGRIILAGEVIKNRVRTLEEVISANVSLTNAIADLEFDTDTTRAAVCTRVENADAAAAKIKNVWRNETINERRLITIVKGYRNTLKNIEYGFYR